MVDKTDGLREPLKEHILESVALLIDIAEQYRRTKSLLGEALALYQRKYGRVDFELPDRLPQALAMGRSPGPMRKRRTRLSNAVIAAIVLTERGEVMVPMRVRDIHRRLVEAGESSTGRPPSLATLQSTIIRSGLFERMGGGLWQLTRPVYPDEIGGEQIEMIGGADN